MKDKDLSLLVARAKDGDSEAFGELYKECFTPVFRYLYLRLGHKNLAEDMAQTVFVKAYANWPKFRYREDKKLLPYFFTIARNLTVDHYRQKEKLVELSEADGLKSSANLLERYEMTEAMNKIYHSLSRLPEEQQTAIIGKYVNGLTNEEIGAMLDKSETAVRQLQSRGLKKLKDLIKVSYE